MTILNFCSLLFYFGLLGCTVLFRLFNNKYYIKNNLHCSVHLPEIGKSSSVKTYNIYLHMYYSEGQRLRRHQNVYPAQMYTYGVVITTIFLPNNESMTRAKFVFYVPFNRQGTYWERSSVLVTCGSPSHPEVRQPVIRCQTY